MPSDGTGRWSLWEHYAPFTLHNGALNSPCCYPFQTWAPAQVAQAVHGQAGNPTQTDSGVGSLQTKVNCLPRKTPPTLLPSFLTTPHQPLRSPLPRTPRHPCHHCIALTRSSTFPGQCTCCPRLPTSWEIPCFPLNTDPPLLNSSSRVPVTVYQGIQHVTFPKRFARPGP